MTIVDSRRKQFILEIKICNPLLSIQHLCGNLSHGTLLPFSGTPSGTPVLDEMGSTLGLLACFGFVECKSLTGAEISILKWSRLYDGVDGNVLS